MAQITVRAKGSFGYHPASGNHLQEGEHYTIEEAAFSEELFDRIEKVEAPDTKAAQKGGKD